MSSNSPLVNYTKISPNKNSPRNHKIDTITIHCYVGQVSVESMGSWFAQTSAQSSSNYGIGVDGKIGLFVPENDRSWCSSNSANDNRAITIECACDKYAPYAINDKVYASLIKLCADICKRNGIKELKWKADKSLIGNINEQNMTVHRWFKNKSCPGDYIYSRLGQIAKEVNTMLGKSSNVNTTNTVLYRVRKVWSDSKTQIGAFNDLNNAKKVADNNPGYTVYDENGKAIYSSKMSSSGSSGSTTFKSYQVRIGIDYLRIRKKPGTEYDFTGQYTGQGVFTIVDEAIAKDGSKWGLLKSYAQNRDGWISLQYTTKI